MNRSASRWLARAGIAFVLVVSAVMWAYAFLIADDKPTDQLGDPSFATAAAPLCRAAKDEIRAAGLVAVHAKTPQERADITGKADAYLRAMVRDLREIAPTTGEDAQLVSAWLNDWDTFFTYREIWIGKLRAGEDAPFLEPQRESGEPAGKAMDAFAVANDIKDCKIPDNY